MLTRTPFTRMWPWFTNPDYIEVDHGKMTARMTRVPTLSEVPYPVQMEPNLRLHEVARDVDADAVHPDVAVVHELAGGERGRHATFPTTSRSTTAR
jgi:hypothetical protein